MGLRESRTGSGEAGGQMGEQQGSKAQGVLLELSEVTSDDVSKVETVALAETLPRGFWASDPVWTASWGPFYTCFWSSFLPLPGSVLGTMVIAMDTHRRHLVYSLELGVQDESPTFREN